MTALTRSDRGGPPSVAAESKLRSLRSVEDLARSMSEACRTTDCAGLDERIGALVRLAALISIGASTTAYRRGVHDALAAGATSEDMVGTVLAIAPTVGLSRLVSGTSGLALALGYDIEAALERLDVPADHWGRTVGQDAVVVTPRSES